MLHWKNKPIDQLSKQELQKALTDSIGTVLTQQGTDKNSEVFSTFLVGLMTGAFIAVLGVYMASML